MGSETKRWKHLSDADTGYTGRKPDRGKDLGANQWHPDADLGNAEKGFDPDAPIATRYTRKYTYEGEAGISRNVSYIPEEEKGYFWKWREQDAWKLEIDGKEVPDYVEPSISTPHILR